MHSVFLWEGKGSLEGGWEEDAEEYLQLEVGRIRAGLPKERWVQ